ncbi:hypothetical protein D3C76_999930 [compost metagenome]
MHIQLIQRIEGKLLNTRLLIHNRGRNTLSYFFHYILCAAVPIRIYLLDTMTFSVQQHIVYGPRIDA